MVQVIKHKCCLKTHSAYVYPSCQNDKNWLSQVEEAKKNGDIVEIMEDAVIGLCNCPKQKPEGIKRYFETYDQLPLSRMKEDPQGEWVRFVDLDVACKFAETPKFDEYGIFEAVMYHPKKGIQIGQGNKLSEAKNWASYMIYAYKCIPMYFLNKSTSEMYPPIGIPKY